jgi:hypothetical protein
MVVDNKRNNLALNGYETNRRAEENNSLPKILGNARREKETGKALATAANDTRRGQSDDGRKKGLPEEKF